MSLRIIAGELRGRKLSTPVGLATRPTPERVREATFNALDARGLLIGSHVVDLFAGSGAMGIEALSRGADTAVFVDTTVGAIRAIRDNLRSLGLEDVATVVRSDAGTFLRAVVGSYDVAFIDPPYEFDKWDDLLGILDAEVAVIESDRRILGIDGEGGAGDARYEVLRERRYGTTFVTIAQRRNSADEGAQRKDR